MTLLTAIVGVGVAPPARAEAVPVARIWGQDAVGTAAAVSADAFPAGASTVYVATVSGYWDALSGGAAAARQGGPMLLTETDALPQHTRDELVRLSPTTIVIQGGVLAVSDAVQGALAAYAPVVVRNAGDTAIGTAVLTSQRAFPAGATSVFVATAASFHDALSGGAAAGRNGAPVLLVEPTGTLDAAVLAEIRRLGADTVYLLGGPAALPEAVETQLLASGVPVQRLWGQTALDTSLRINDVTVPAVEQVFLVTEQAYYDGLAAGPAASVFGGTVVLTDGQCLSTAARAYVQAQQPSRVVVVGGPLAMGEALDTLTGCTPEITATALPTATVGSSYTATVAATGGLAPHVWTAIGLPEGLSLDVGTGVISGVPTTDGVFAVGVMLVSGSGLSATATVDLQVKPDPRAVLAVANGSGHSCALTAVGAVRCWGDNALGQLGDGSTQRRFRPVPVSGLGGGVAAIAAGGNSSCALTDDGAVWCWGSSLHGKLGDGFQGDRTTPVAVTGLDGGVTAIAVGQSHTCAALDEGGMRCWGGNEYGQLGEGSASSDRLTPVAVAGLDEVVTDMALGYLHTCALTAEGAVQCWGYNARGEVGAGTAGPSVMAPVIVPGLESGVLDIASAGYSTCAVTGDGAVRCWGSNIVGQLGDGTTTDRSAPVPVAGLESGITAVGAGPNVTCALDDSGLAQCWGSNGSGQLGDGTTTPRTTPVAVVGDNVFTAIVGGGAHTCAVTVGFAVKCWGSNAVGQLADSTTTDHWTPQNVWMPTFSV